MIGGTRAWNEGNLQGNWRSEETAKRPEQATSPVPSPNGELFRLTVEPEVEPVLAQCAKTQERNTGEDVSINRRGADGYSLVKFQSKRHFLRIALVRARQIRMDPNIAVVEGCAYFIDELVLQQPKESGLNSAPIHQMMLAQIGSAWSSLNRAGRETGVKCDEDSSRHEARRSATPQVRRGASEFRDPKRIAWLVGSSGKRSRIFIRSLSERINPQTQKATVPSLHVPREAMAARQFAPNRTGRVPARVSGRSAPVPRRL